MQWRLELVPLIRGFGPPRRMKKVLLDNLEYDTFKQMVFYFRQKGAASADKGCRPSLAHTASSEGCGFGR